MPQLPYLESLLLEVLRSSDIQNLYQFTLQHHISYPHAWQTLRRLQARGLVLIQRSDRHGGPLIIQGVMSNDE